MGDPTAHASAYCKINRYAVCNADCGGWQYVVGGSEKQPMFCMPHIIFIKKKKCNNCLSWFILPNALIFDLCSNFVGLPSTVLILWVLTRFFYDDRGYVILHDMQ